MVNPIQQIMAWFGVAVSDIAAHWPTVRLVLVGGLSLYLFHVLVERYRSDSDPSVQYRSETAAGSTSLTLSGTHVTLLIAGAIAVLLWPLPLANVLVGFVLFAVVVVHYIMEKREGSAS